MGDQVLMVALFVVGGVIGVVIWLMPVMHRRGPLAALPGRIKIKRRPYTYEMGDVLLRPGELATFAGMDIHLPKALSGKQSQKALGQKKIKELKQRIPEIDIEIIDSHIRLMVPAGMPVNGNHRLQGILKKAAKEVVKEVDALVPRNK